MRYTINGIEWSVFLVPPSSNKLKRSSSIQALGMCDWSTKAIYLCNALSGELLRKVLTHEICHSVIFSYKIKLNIMQEEFLCDFVASFGGSIIDIVNRFTGRKNIMQKF